MAGGGHLCTVTQGTTHQPSPHDFNGLFCACTQRELFLPWLASWEREGPPIASNRNSNSWAAPTCGEEPYGSVPSPSTQACFQVTHP